MNKRNFKIPERSQLLMFANVDLNSVASPGGVLQTIDTLVDTLDTSAIEAKYDLESDRGASPYHPKTLIKVGLYAMYNCRFSLRKMESDTKMNLGYKWLTGDEEIDHTTFGKFFSKYPELISDLFSQVVSICENEDLINFDILSIDSIKLRANASYKQFRNLKGIEKEEAKIKTKLATIIDSALREEKEIEEAEKKALENRQTKLQNAKEILQKRIDSKGKDKSEKEKKKIKENEKVNITDPESILVQQANGEINPAFAISNSVDSKRDIITGIEVHDGYNDAKSLLPVIEESEKNCSQPHDTVCADSGYSSFENLEKLEVKKQKALIPDKRMEIEKNESTKRGPYDRSNFKYNRKKNIYKCPIGCTLTLSAQYTKDGRLLFRYENRNACANCSERSQCTKSKFRTITRDSNEEIRDKMRNEINKKKNSERYKIRAHCSESPYGQIKHNLKYKTVMRRGKQKVVMEISMLFMLHNILKMR